MTPPFGHFVAILDAVACLLITIVLWSRINAYQTMWPLPGLYFFEMVALSILSAIIFVRGDHHHRFITWGAAGAMSAFSILGALSVGFFYLPLALIIAVLSVISDVRNQRRITAHLVSFLIGGLAQSFLMLAAIRLLDPGAIF